LPLSWLDFTAARFVLGCTPFPNPHLFAGTGLSKSHLTAAETSCNSSLLCRTRRFKCLCVLSHIRGLSPMLTGTSFSSMYSSSTRFQTAFGSLRPSRSAQRFSSPGSHPGLWPHPSNTRPPSPLIARSPVSFPKFLPSFTPYRGPYRVYGFLHPLASPHLIAYEWHTFLPRTSQTPLRLGFPATCDLIPMILLPPLPLSSTCHFCSLRQFGAFGPTPDWMVSDGTQASLVPLT